MAQPTQLTPTEQDALVKQIGLAMLRVAPEDWEQLTVDYRAVGRYAESTGQVTFTDGSAEPWEMPADLRSLFARLRAGMYREGRGTWFNARYRLDHPSSYNLEYDRDEPVWDAPPPPQAYPDDMRMFPRSDENVPEWLRRRLASAPPLPPAPGGPPGPGGPGGPSAGPPTPRFRVARVFDGPGEDGRPSVNRPPVDEMDIQELLDYLDGAPLVGPARGYDVDRLDPNGQQSVPIAFHTDGTWIWPAAVNYFLREHDISPETDLIEHIRRMRFKLVPVDEQTRSAAQLFLGPPPPGPGPRPGPPPAPAPTRALPVPAPPPVPGPPRAALPSQGPPAQQIDQLRARLEDLDVPDTAYQIGAPTGRGWVMEQTDEGWRVGWHDREWVAPAVFEDVADASAFLLGKLLLDTDRWAAGPKNPELPPSPEEHGFAPLSAPIEDFGSPGRPAGPVKPPPGTPGYTDSPGFSEPSEGFMPPRPGTPPRPAPTMAMEAPDGLDTSARGMDAPAHGLGFDSPGSADGFIPPGRGSSGHGLDADRSPGFGLDASGPGGFDSPGRGFDGAGRGDSPSHGLDPADRGLFDSAGRGDSPDYGLDVSGRGGDSADRGFDSAGRGDSPGHGLDTPGRGFDAGRGDSSGHGLDSGDRSDSMGRGFDSARRGDAPGHGLDPAGRGFDAGRGDSPDHGLDPASRGFDASRGDAPGHGLGTPGRGFDPGRGDAPGHGLDSGDRGESMGRGFDVNGRGGSPSHGLDPAGRGFDSGRGDAPGHGLDPAGRGFDSSRGDSPGHGLDTPGRGFDAGRGDSSGHGLDSPGRGFDPAGQAGDSPGHEFAPPGRGFDAGRGDAPGHGLDSAGHGLDSAGRGLDPSGRGGDPAGRGGGLDSPPRGVELPGADQATVLASRPTNGAAAAPAGSEWPITPLPGEPPLTLFRGKRVIELEPGMEIDRFGEDDGNLVYAAGTPFSERSLVPEWIDRPYHVYRVRQPVQVLSGAAIPWFDQPGGGTAFLLPDAIGDMVAQGQLMEVSDRDRPPA